MQEYRIVFSAQRETYERREKKLMNDVIDFVILSELSKNGENHGYNIIKNIKKDFGYNPGTSRIYPTLNNLEKEGYITPKKIEVGGRIRKNYRLTLNGKLFFQNGLRKLEIIVEKLKIENPISKWREKAKFHRQNL
ncbi:MAG: PadR family transcriptional regulator [Candidatus Aenigmatarchaeota archaeon]